MKGSGLKGTKDLAGLLSLFLKITNDGVGWRPSRLYKMEIKFPAYPNKQVGSRNMIPKGEELVEEIEDREEEEGSEGKETERKRDRKEKRQKEKEK